MMAPSKKAAAAITTTTIAAVPRTFLDLPESMHTVIARFLKLNEVLAVTTTCARLQGWCVCEELRLFSHPDLHGSTLAKLLRRFPH